jgi:hypothetical protein
VPKKPKLHKNELNTIFKISLTFRFDKLSNLSKSVHTGENSQILTVSNKKCMWQLSGWGRVDICMTFHMRAFDFFYNIAH